MKKIILIILMFVASALFAANDQADNQANNQILLKAQIIETIKVGDTKSAKARFTDLKDKAIEIGINEIFINGKIHYTPQGNYQELKISWESLENSQGLSKTNYSGLSQNFYSSLTTDDKQILPPQEITIKVDETVLMAALKTLNEKSKLKAEKVALDDKTIAQIKPEAQTSNASNGQASTLPGADFNATEKEDVTTSVVEEQCPIRYSVDDLNAYEQKSVNTVDSNGNTLSVGECLDSGVTYKLSKVYGAPCTPLISESQVYQSYRVTGIVAGEDKIIRDCQVGLTENQIAIQTTTDQCNYEHHLDLGLSYQTQRKFYELNGEIINISQCESNKKTYQHTESVCSYDLEVSPGFAVPQTKLYITLDDGIESIVRNCTAHSSQLALVKKNCIGSERYLHDFNASISYLQQETWINNPFDNNKEVKLNSCQISATTYQHLQQASNCARSFEDHNLLTRQAVRTYIDDAAQTPSEIFISECSNGFNDIPYTVGEITLNSDGNTKMRNYTRGDGTNYQTTEPTESKTFVYSQDNLGIYDWTVPTGVTSVYAVVVSGQGEGGTSGHTYKNGQAGGYSQIKSITASGGAGGLGVSQHTFVDGSIWVYGKAGLQNTRVAVFSVSAGETLSIVVGRGGAGGGSNGAGGRGFYEPHDSDGGSAYEAGNPGANGSVSIKY